jgi:arginyl-tRNA synthetase
MGSASEKALKMELARIIDLSEAAYKELAPHKLCAYIYDLSNAFNRFYHENKILGEEDLKRQASFIQLITVTKRALEQCITLLGMECPERM